MKNPNILQSASAFDTHNEPVDFAPHGKGHINDTYLVTDAGGQQYILQRINQTVFRNPQGVMENMLAVTSHIKQKVTCNRQVIDLLPTKEGVMWHVDEHGDYWRKYHFIGDSICLEMAETPHDFKESGMAYGHFQGHLSDFPAASLHETIPNFHDTPNRYKLFKEALSADALGRTKDAAREIDFALEREEYAGTLMSLLKSGDIPLRVTHNDTKLSNVLLDTETRKALCVIDLDTVMPGLTATDFGDAIRFGASTAAEDETDLDKVSMSMRLFEAFTDGYLSTCGGSLTQAELLHLRDGVKMMMLECGLRFLTDYLAGDTYFRIHREKHNLDRARTQFKLVTEAEKFWDEMQKVITR